jgi:hypothetical protein
MAVVTADVETAGVDFELELGGRISGRVMSGRTGDAMKRVAVHARSLIGDVEIEVVTDAEGEYRTPALPPGVYVVWIDGRRGQVGQVFGGEWCQEACDLTFAPGLEVASGIERAHVDFTLE